MEIPVEYTLKYAAEMVLNSLEAEYPDYCDKRRFKKARNILRNFEIYKLEDKYFFTSAS